MIKREAGGEICGNYEKYSGLPAMVGKSKYNTFTGIKRESMDKVYSWKNNFISKAGKEILRKAVLQAVRTYIMSVFKLSKKLSEEIFALMAKLW